MSRSGDEMMVELNALLGGLSKTAAKKDKDDDKDDKECKKCDKKKCECDKDEDCKKCGDGPCKCDKDKKDKDKDDDKKDKKDDKKDKDDDKKDKKDDKDDKKDKKDKDDKGEFPFKKKKDAKMMNILTKLVKLAEELDESGATEAANLVDVAMHKIVGGMKKSAQDGEFGELNFDEQDYSGNLPESEVGVWDENAYGDEIELDDEDDELSNANRVSLEGMSTSDKERMLVLLKEDMENDDFNDPDPEVVMEHYDNEDIRMRSEEVVDEAIKSEI